MKKLLALLTLTALILSSCADMGDANPPDTTAETTAAITSAVTTTDRSILTNPEQYTEDEIGILNAMWKKYSHLASDDYTIDAMAQQMKYCDLIPCESGYILNAIDFESVPNTYSTEVIGDYEFRHVDLIKLDYYSDGKLYLLKDAYQNGIITEDELRGAWEEFYNRHASRYEEEIW